jgi:hypothetical protein
MPELQAQRAGDDAFERERRGGHEAHRGDRGQAVAAQLLAHVLELLPGKALHGFAAQDATRIVRGQRREQDAGHAIGEPEPGTERDHGEQGEQRPRKHEEGRRRVDEDDDDWRPLVAAHRARPADDPLGGDELGQRRPAPRRSEGRAEQDCRGDLAPRGAALCFHLRFGQGREGVLCVRSDTSAAMPQARDFFIWSTSAELAEAVLMSREAMGMTQAELAARARVGRKFVVQLERGKPTLRVDKVMHVLAVLGLAPLLVPAAALALLPQ